MSTQRDRWIEPERMRAVTLPGRNLAWLVGAPGRPGMKREVMCRRGDRPPAVVEHQHGRAWDLYVRDDQAITLTYRYAGVGGPLGDLPVAS